MAFTLLGVYSPLRLCWDNYTMRRGLLRRYIAMAFPQPQVNNGAIRPRILYVRMIIISIHIIINLNPNQR